jgi:hypothetical protein
MASSVVVPPPTPLVDTWPVVAPSAPVVVPRPVVDAAPLDAPVLGTPVFDAAEELVLLVLVT